MLAGQMTPLRQALGFGAVRWSLGLALGILVFLVIGSVDRTSLAVLYFGIYWVLGGLVISFATDAVSPDGLAGRFCVGRCLC
jgi:hypothetical protein